MSATKSKILVAFFIAKKGEQDGGNEEKAKLSIEEKIARREEMARKNSNELKVLKRKLNKQKRNERDMDI